MGLARRVGVAFLTALVVTGAFSYVTYFLIVPNALEQLMRLELFAPLLFLLIFAVGVALGK
jgi:hypothetical protein